MCEEADKHPGCVNKFSNGAESTASMGLRKKAKVSISSAKNKETLITTLSPKYLPYTELLQL